MKGEKEVDSTSPIFGENLENVAITGGGIFDGGGERGVQLKKANLAMLTGRRWSSLAAC